MSDIGHFKKLVESMERQALGEDWGSSDWYPIIKHIDEYIDLRGMSPENIERAAREQADFYHDSMGYETPEDALTPIVSAWLRMSENGKQWSAMFAPVEEAKANGKESDEPYQNYKPDEANNQYDKKTGEWSRSGQYDKDRGVTEAVAGSHFDIEIDGEDIIIHTLGGEPVAEMPIDDFIGLVSKFNRIMRRD